MKNIILILLLFTSFVGISQTIEKSTGILYFTDKASLDAYGAPPSSYGAEFCGAGTPRLLYRWDGSAWVESGGDVSFSDTLTTIATKTDLLSITGAFIKVADYSLIAGQTAANGETFYADATKSYYSVQPDSITGYETDEVAVHTLSGGNFAVYVIQDVNNFSTFGISEVNDTTTNTTRLQNAIAYIEGTGKTFYSDADSIAITTSANHILVQDNIKIDFNNNKLKVYPDLCTDVENDVFRIAPLRDGVSIEFNNIHAFGAEERGFLLDGTFNPSTGLVAANFIHSIGGVGDSSLVLTVDNLILDSTAFFNAGILFNGAKGILNVSNSYLHCSKTNAVGVFGVGMTAIIQNTEFRKSGYTQAETSINDSYGVAVYFHPHVTTLIDNCKFYDMPRAVQYSSGSAYYETTWDYAVTPTDFQILRNSYFDITITEKAFVNSWYYPFGIVDNCTFDCTGTPILLVAPLTIKNSHFLSNSVSGFETSYPSLNRNWLHKYYIQNCDFSGNIVAAIGSDTGDSPVKGFFNFSDCLFEPTNGGITLTNLIFTTDSSRIGINIKDSYIKISDTNNPFYNLPTKADLLIENTSIEYGATGRGFSIAEANYEDANDGSILFKKCRFITLSAASTPVWFYVSGTAVNPMSFDFDFENCRFPEGQIRTGFYNTANTIGFAIPLKEGLQNEVVTTNYIPLKWRYNEYTCTHSGLKDAFLEAANNPSAGGIADPFRAMKGDLFIVGGIGGCTIITGGNLNVPFDIEVDEGKRVRFVFNEITQVWDYTGDTPASMGEMYIDIATPATKAATVGTPIKLTGWIGGILKNGITHSDGRLTNESGRTVTFSLNTSISFAFSSNNSEISVYIYKGVNSDSKAEMYRKIGTGGDFGNGGQTMLVELADDEYIEVFYDSDSAGTITIDAANVNIRE